MEVCGEHPSPIAFVDEYQRSCPACEEIEQLKKDHKSEVNDLDQQISDADDVIDQLKQDLEDKD